MAIICSICGKSQSGWIMDFPLNETMEERICAKCHDRLEIINKLNSDKRDEAIQYITNAIKCNSEIKDYVKKYIKNVLQNGKEDVQSPEEIKKYKEEQELQKLKSVMLTSGNSFEGYRIIKYLDFISAETVVGIGVIKALLGNITNAIGTESNALSSKLETVREATLYKLRKKAYEMGANGIVALDLDYTMFGETMVAVVMNGTAIVMEKCEIYASTNQYEGEGQ